MYLLDYPKYNVEDFFDEMLEGRHDNHKNKYLITRLLSIKPLLAKAQNDYIVRGEEKELYKLEESKYIELPNNFTINDIPDKISTAEMGKVYTDFMVEKPGSKKMGRKIYDLILSNSYYNLCPYCSHREVKTIDHYFPKSDFALYAVSPVNLIPCCSDCNKDKLDDYTLEERKMLVHPYFDDISHVDWLKCSIIEGEWPITFSYGISEEKIEDDILSSRISYQFQRLKLDELYADNATREFNKRVKSLVKEYNSNPSNKGLDYFYENIDTYKYENLNSWQTKMFVALKKSDWFLENAIMKLEEYYLN